MCVRVGDRIEIVGFKPDSNGEHDPAEKDYIGKVGIVEHIDDMGNLHGTWGSLAVLKNDYYRILAHEK